MGRVARNRLIGLALAAVIYGGARFEDVEDALKVEGDRRLAERFVRLFPLPPKAPSTVSAPAD